MDIRRFRWWFLLLWVLSIFIISCEKDDDHVASEKEEKKQEQTTGEEKPEGELSLYKIDGENLKKIKRFKANNRVKQGYLTRRRHRLGSFMGLKPRVHRTFALRKRLINRSMFN